MDAEQFVFAEIEENLCAIRTGRFIREDGNAIVGRVSSPGAVDAE
jgi:hypothetical protein